jgi:hypothetical protein
MRSFLLASLVTVWPAMAFAQSILPDGRIDMTPPTLDVLGAIDSSAAGPQDTNANEPPRDVRRYVELHSSEGSGALPMSAVKTSSSTANPARCPISRADARAIAFSRI